MRTLLYSLLICGVATLAGCNHNLTKNGCKNGQCGGGNCGGGNCGGVACGNGQCGDSCNGNCGFGNGQLGASFGVGNGLPTRVGMLPQGYMSDLNNGMGGPAGPTYGYPYYTTRGPRDFLLDNPPAIGP